MIDKLMFDFHNNELLTGITLKSTSPELPYGFSINRGNHYSDEEVKTMRMKLAESLGIEFINMAFMSQSHSDIIEVYEKDKVSYEADGIITDQIGICLNVSVADCIGLILYDPINKILGAVHSGWKGTKQNIAQNAVKKMANVYGSKPEKIQALISPSASGEVYEVGEDVAKYFPKSIKQISEAKYLFDNKNQVKMQLLEVGLLSENIQIQQECSINDLRFHSFRRDKEKSGRMSVFAMMK